jgi:hypothetical protein
LFNYEKTMLAAHFRRNKVIVQLDQRVFRKKNKKPHHSTLGAVFNPFGHGPSPLVVVPTFSGAEELFAGQPVLIGESRSGWSTGPIFAAFAEHFCRWLISHRAEIRVQPDEEAVLVLNNAQIHADPEAIRVFRANHARVITLPPHCTLPAARRCCLGEAYEGSLLGTSSVAGRLGRPWAIEHAHGRKNHRGIGSDEGACQVRHVCH